MKKINYQEAKKANKILKGENNKKTIKYTKNLIEDFINNNKTDKSNRISLLDYLKNNNDIVINHFISKKGNETYILKNGKRELQIKADSLQYSQIDIKTKEIYNNVGIEF